MSVAKKIEMMPDDKINANIQRKFDLVFVDKSSTKTRFSNEKTDRKLEDPQNFNVEEMIMERNDGSNNSKNKPKLDFDTVPNNKASVIPVGGAKSNLSKKDNKELELFLDFDVNLEKSGLIKPTAQAPSEATKVDMDEGFTLDDSDIGDIDFREDATQKTLIFNPAMLQKVSSENSSIDMMSNDEAKANIESTIKNIVRSDLEKTMDFDQSKLQTDISQIEDSELQFGNTPPNGFSLSEIENEDDSFDLDAIAPPKKDTKEENNEFDLSISSLQSSDATMDFNLSELTRSADSEDEEDEVDAATKIAQLNFDQISMPTPTKLVEVQIKSGVAVESIHNPNFQSEESSTESISGQHYTSGLNSEDSMRYQATLRALREEREEMLIQIKNLKNDSKELEQDNLTLKANLDEAKIEISILRKRHMLEIEDLKYRASLSEEKKALADERAKQADSRREKLEQKVRIDFNQVKQREKELESKLELLSMDVDSQVHSRDQKILELRRKIDALEFNMENTSIKEQKSHEDKRKLEDRLNKIMKTLRHSIKNIEDDIDHMVDESDHQKDKS